MSRPIVVDAGQEIACPKCSHVFLLSEGISRQTIDGLAEQFEHSQNDLDRLARIAHRHFCDNDRKG